jgi:hypothetical protein
MPPLSFYVAMNSASFKAQGESHFMAPVVTCFGVVFAPPGVFVGFLAKAVALDGPLAQLGAGQKRVAAIRLRTLQLWK